MRAEQFGKTSNEAFSDEGRTLTEACIYKIGEGIIRMAAKNIGPLNTLLMLCLITFWGSSFVVVKFAIREGMSPVAIATFRFLVAGAMFVLALLFMKARSKDYMLMVRKRDSVTLLLLALSGVTFFFTIQYTGIQFAGASVAAILVCLLSPLLISLFSARLFKENLTRRQILGIGVAGTGTAAVVGGGTLSINGGVSFLFGSLILLLTPVLWAVYTLVGKKVMNRYDPFVIVAYVNIIGGLLLIPFSLAENSFFGLLMLSSGEWLAILFLAFTCSLLGYSIWFYVMKRVKAAVTSSFLFAEPLVTVLFAREEITSYILAGGILIAVGVYLVLKQ
jgi:drug/metabolite transporter (DMT)-like permease